MERKALLPVGIQSFEDIRKNGYIYVDKTEDIYNLSANGKAYFLSRPRRFGKSLLISTMDAYFSGQKELFNGLKIEKLEKDWFSYPVFHFDFSGMEYKTREDLEVKLHTILKGIASKFNLSTSEKSLSLIFGDFIEQAAKKYQKNVVVLVDEYDKPLLETLNNIKVNDEYRSLLRAFLGILKNYDKYLKFVFVTGVSKFSKVSVFSDLNQLNDITLSDSAQTLCGITQQELESNFKNQIEELATENNLTLSDCMGKLRKNYDGYHFSKELVDLYNPYSILKTFSDNFFGTYWFETGTPTFLINQLENNNYDIYNFSDGVEYSVQTLMNKSDADTDIVQLLYQTGYITIKKWDREYNTFTLKYPNDEVEFSFLSILLPSFLKQNQFSSDFWIREFYKDIKDGNIDSFMTRLSSIITSVPYAPSKRTSEHDFQITVYLIFTLLGQFTTAESYTNKGRIDCTVETKDFVYIFEFKVDAAAQNALSQIVNKSYGDKYISSKKKILKIGASFDGKEKKLSEWCYLKD